MSDDETRRTTDDTSDEVPTGVVESIRVVRREVGRLTQITLAIGSSLGNRLGPTFDAGYDPRLRDPEADHRETESGLPDLALGITLAVQDAIFDGAERLGATVDAARPATERVANLPFVAPVLNPIRKRVRANLEALTDRGIDARADGRDYASRMLDALLTDAVQSPRVITVADDVVGRLAVPLIDGALPVAMDKMGSDPDAIMGLLENLLEPIMDAALPVAIDKLGDDPEIIGGLIEKLLDGIMDAALPVALDKLSADPSAIEALVDKLLEPILDSALPVAFEKLQDDPDAIVGLVRAILDPVLAEALPSVLDQLNQDPEVVRTLVLGQSTSMAHELANTVRSRAVTGDDRIERIARKITARKAKPALLPSEQHRGPGNELAPPGDADETPS